jgi:hypothetical protein
MKAQDSGPSPQEILARINSALAESGLKNHKAVREPLPLFKHLLQEWHLGVGIPKIEADEAEIYAWLLSKRSLQDVQTHLRSIFNEAITLSNAHGTLSAWSRRDLDQEMRRLQKVVEAAQHQLTLKALKHS